MEIMIKLSNSSGHSNIFSDNEIGDVVMADAIISDTGDEEETCQMFLWETVDSCSGPKSCFL